MVDWSSTLSRRSLLAGGAALAGGAVAARAAAAVPHPLRERAGRAALAPASWPLAAHDLRATRHAPGAAGLERRWRAHFPGGVPATAAIAGEVVYAASAKGAVAALALADGRELWRVQLGTSAYGSGEGRRELGFFSGVAVAPGAVVVASERVHCLDPATGAARWTAAPLRTKSSDDYFWGAPTIVGGMVLVGSGSGGEVPTARGGVTAYSLADGSLLWSTATVPAGANGGGVIGPTSVDPGAGVAYVATGAPYKTLPGPNPGTCSLLALRLSDGKVIWRDQVHRHDTHGFDFNSAPVISGARLFATNKDGIYAWNRFTRKRLWHRRLSDPFAAGEAVAGPTGGPEGGPIASDGHRVYVLSNDPASGGCVAAALAPHSGRVLWRRPLPAPTFAAPALGGGRLFVAGSDGTLRALDAGSGRVAGQAPLGEASSAAPAIARGHLVVGTGAEPFIPGSSLVCLG